MQTIITVKSAKFQQAGAGMDVVIEGIDGSIHNIPYIRNRQFVQPNQKNLRPYYQSHSSDAGFYDLVDLKVTIDCSTESFKLITSIGVN